MKYSFIQCVNVVLYEESKSGKNLAIGGKVSCVLCMN